MSARILIADDTPTVRTALRGLLEGSGPWEIVVVENGQEAITQAQALKPNLIILDLVMPVMDGLTAARQISKLLPDIPMLIHTMHWSPQVEIEAQKVGVRKVVSKADSRLLVSTVQQFLMPPSPSADPATAPSNNPTPNLLPSPPVIESSTAAPPTSPPIPLPGVLRTFQEIVSRTEEPTGAKVPRG